MRVGAKFDFSDYLKPDSERSVFRSDLNFPDFWALTVAPKEKMSYLNVFGVLLHRFLPSLVLLLAGCAAQVPLMSTSENKLAKVEAVPTDKAVIYVFRESTFCAQKAHFSVAVNGRIVGWNANNTYYKLILPPGFHELEAFGLVEQVTGGTIIFSSSNLALKLDAGNSYYVSQYSCLNDKLRQVNKTDGVSSLAAMQLAKFDTRNFSTTQVRQMVKNGIPVFEQVKVKVAGSGIAREVSTSELNTTFTSILAGVGLALLIGLTLYGAAHSSGASPPSPPSALLFDRPSIVQRENLLDQSATIRRSNVTTPQIASPPVTSYVSTSGDTYQVSGDNIFSATRGERWTINGNIIRGTNGSSYRIVGDTVYSDSGQSYRRSGNSILGSDGSLCSIIGILISCK